MFSYEAALRSNRYPADIQIPFGAPIPGGPLASDLAQELERLGFGPVAIVEEQPLWLVRVPAFGHGSEVVVSLYEPSREPSRAVWNVSVPSGRGLIDRLLRRQESDSVVAFVKAVHFALTAIPEVVDVRWFNAWPSEPYSSSSFQRTPNFP